MHKSIHPRDEEVGLSRRAVAMAVDETESIDFDAVQVIQEKRGKFL